MKKTEEQIGIRKRTAKMYIEENKELKEEVKKRKMVADENGTGYDMLEEENKVFKEKIDTLELCIKNKDELLEEYRKKIDKLRTDNIYEEGLYN